VRRARRRRNLAVDAWRISDAEHAQLCTNMRRVIEARYGSLEAVLELEREVMVRAFTPA
jgi:hypothetical protein